MTDWTVCAGGESSMLAERIQKYVLWLGFTQKDIDTIREIMLEP